ncbi:MAG TPA: lipid A biosynthesis acyltransferase [bacterium]|nr:lipid A biosynthesis acyltransferase [bacterium]
MSLPDPLRQRALWHPRYFGLWLAVLLLWGIAWLPVRWRMALGAWLGRQMLKRNIKRQRIIEINLALCFPDWDAAARAALALSSAERAGQALIDLSTLWLRSEKAIQRRWQVHGREHLDAVLAAGRAPLFVTGHAVGLDMGAAAMTVACGGGVGPYNPTDKPFLDAWFVWGRTRFGSQLMTRAEGLRPLLKALKSGLAAYYIPDEDHGTAHSVFAPFFGVQKATLPLLGRLAEQGRAEVVPFFTQLDPTTGIYHLHIESALSNFAGADALADATRMNAMLEAMIRRDPSQYMWSFKLFKTRPAGEPGMYP